MAIIKCKMCGGDMELSPDKTLGTCEYCGSTMTMPKVDDDQRAAAFDRGNHFRRLGEFDKALSVYERIVQEDENDAEAHWCCALCRFGIEYVKDPATGEYLPTCHRASFDSFLEDVDYQAAVTHADAVARKQYEKDGEQIAAVQRGILSTVQKEEPFDVFICYKESDEQGRRTVDSTLAQDIYYQLTEQNRRVFFARITLEDKAGQEYEPYIFAALHSAKVMVVVGTKPEYLNAVWVKNEWSRYLALMKQDHKRLLIPCYRDMDPYDLPEQLSVLQAYDMGKIGFIQDLIRGISKVLDADKKPEAAKTVVTVQGEGGSNLTALLKRGNMALEDGEWNRADEFFEQVLNLDAECAVAFFGKYLARERHRSIKEFVARWTGEKAKNLSEEKKEACPPDDARIKKAVEKYRVEGYLHPDTIEKKFQFDRGYTSRIAGIQKVIGSFQEIWKQDKLLSRAQSYASPDFAKQLEGARQEISTALNRRAEEIKQQEKQRVEDIQKRYAQHLDKVEKELASLHADAVKRREKDIADAKAKAAKEAEEAKAWAKRNKMIGIITAAVAAVGIAVLVLLKFVIIPGNQYKDAEQLLANGEYDSAIAAFEALGDYKDSAERIQEVRDRQMEARYQQAEALLAEGDTAGAAMQFGTITDYKDARERSFSLWENVTVRKSLAAGDYHTVGLKADGTVEAVGDNADGQCNVGSWSNIVAVDAGGLCTVGLKADGTVVGAGTVSDVSSWSDIVAVSTCGNHTVGLRADGTVVAEGRNEYGQCDVADWNDIVAVDAAGVHTVGLKADGTVVAVGANGEGQCGVDHWSNIVAVAAGRSFTIGLQADGTVVATGASFYGQCDVSDWHDIVAVAAGGVHTVGLKADGTVVVTGRNNAGQCNATTWQYLVAAAAGDNHTVGLKADGTVVAVGYNYVGQCDVSSWTDIKVPEKSEK